MLGDDSHLEANGDALFFFELGQMARDALIILLVGWLLMPCLFFVWSGGSSFPVPFFFGR